MRSIRRIGSKRLLAQIQKYEETLSSERVVGREDTIECHSAKLVLYKDAEWRLRSIQTLASVSSKNTVPSAVKELVSISNRWPKKAVDETPIHLLSVLRDFRRVPEED